MRPVLDWLLVVALYVVLMAWIGLLMVAGLWLVLLLPPVPYLGGVLLLAVAFGALWFGIWSASRAPAVWRKFVRPDR